MDGVPYPNRGSWFPLDILAYANMIFSMKAISVSVSEDDYEEFRRVAEQEGRPIAQLIREAMAMYRELRLQQKPRLAELPRLIGHKPVGALPSRSELYDEIYADRGAP